MANTTTVTRAVVAAAAGVLGLAVVLLGDGRAGAIVLIGGLVALAVVAIVLVAFPGRLGDVLLLTAIGSMTIPIDKYFFAVDHVGGWPGVRVSASDIALYASVPLFALGAWLRRTGNAVPKPVLITYALILAQYLVTLFGAARRDLAAFELLSAVHALFTAFMVGALFRRELLRPVIALMALQVTVHTVFAVAQVATGRPIGASWFQGAQLVSEAFETGQVALRPSGLFDHPIVYADMLLLMLPVLLASCFVPGGRVWRAALIGTLVVGSAGLALTLSRGAWISTAVGGMVLVMIALRHRWLSRRQVGHLIAGTALAALVVVPPIAQRTYSRIIASNESNLTVRFEVNWIAWSMIQAHPLTGIGLSNFIPVMDQYDPTNVMRRFPATVHNLYLLEGAEAGVPGALLVVTLFAVIIAIAWRRLPMMRDQGAAWVAAAIVAGLTGFLVSQLADFSHRLEPLRSVIWMNLGLLFALQRPDTALAGRRWE